MPVDRSPLELHRRRKVKSRDANNLRRIRSHTQEPGVVAVSDLVAVERPVPTQARVIYSAFDGRAMKHVGQVFRIPNNRRAPPVCKRGRRIVAFVLIPVRRKGVAVFIGVELHVNADLPQIVQARGAIRLRFGLRQSREQQGGEDGDDRDDHQQFDECEALPPARRTGCGSVR